MASLKRDIATYEKWLAKRCAVVKADLEAKHERMRRGAFDFLRCTYFRWARTIESACPALADAPRIACVGDLHVENFGTWRDADGRLVWGVNDFDEAAVMPYAFDLVRLVTSVRLMPGHGIAPAAAADAVLEGYRKGLAKPRATLLDRREPWLRPFADESARAVRDFWREVKRFDPATPPADARRVLARSLPAGAKIERFVAVRKGGGSLGRPRYMAIAAWNSGPVLREAKATVPSAWDWAQGKKPTANVAAVLAHGPFRSPDPSQRLDGAWSVRRVAPDAHKIEIDVVERQGLGAQLLEAMGAELGAIHAAGRRAAKVRADLDRRKRGWLHRAAAAAEAMTVADQARYAR